ncbi:High-affinity nickel-transporter [Pseudomonas amygdali pv. tabaci]|nr:High-affinity nickel-transporter [Pseudomonas amygdali pv. tabaci]
MNTTTPTAYAPVPHSCYKAPETGRRPFAQHHHHDRRRARVCGYRPAAARGRESGVPGQAYVDSGSYRSLPLRHARFNCQGRAHHWKPSSKSPNTSRSHMPNFVELLQQGGSHAWLYFPSLLGALHGLEPGHSKTMMAAFIVAIRGSVKQAVMLGVAATVSHTAVVWLVAIGGMYLGQILMFGLTGGLIPCPAAITVLLLCLQVMQVTLGAMMVICFSLGLAVTLVTVGAAAAISARKASNRFPWLSAAARRAPYLSSVLIICVGMYVGVNGWISLHS